jgi:hypothetical protein
VKKEERLEDAKSTARIWYIMRWGKLRRRFIKLLLILNVLLFFMSLVNNQPSMVLFLFNTYYLYKYYLDQYPEERLKQRDRFEGDFQ